MTLVPEINKKETKKNARAVLSQYRRLNRIAERAPIDLKSPIITDMPRSGAQNGSQDAFLEWIDAEIERDAIVAALAKLGLVSRQILYYSFCDLEKRSNYEIGNSIGGYSEKNIEKLKSIALVEFAEAYRKGKLISYNKC
ncbi:ArpU family phage packaging/lysis transcriptional regulator [Enterococcus sp.]|uniref:ArpU family phage packaging/lysis transcriptional regulator n=1 Tax=Enterococcus sp. TaxID=35783 RepID=UPI00289BD2B4|nr:ArpU family phage packaging/lysis transcriptional regulator [Enterococcus sp.]